MAKDYAQSFYRSKAWKTARGEALRRDGFTCQDCQGRAEEVHHIIELTPDNIHDPMVALNIDNLQSLCHNCHTKVTHKQPAVDDGYKFDDDGYVVERYPPRK